MQLCYNPLSMRELSVNIDHEAFDRVGIQPSFDREKYLQLLSVATSRQTLVVFPTVIVVPRYDLGLSWAERLEEDIRDLDNMAEKSIFGHYVAGSNEVTVRVVRSVSKVNNILRHETFHWAEDIEGKLVPEMLEAEAIWKGHSPTSAVGALIDQYKYFKLPFERRARAFASDRKVKKIAGDIITF